jgi:very-short-patch-repair endonuclease
LTNLEAEFLFLIRVLELPEPVPEYRFSDERKWRFDFAWHKDGLAAEVEGGVYIGGRHSRGKGYENDCEKYDYAALAGWKVLRFTAGMLRDGRAEKILLRAFGKEDRE